MEFGGDYHERPNFHVYNINFYHSTPSTANQMGFQVPPPSSLQSTISTFSAFSLSHHITLSAPIKCCIRTLCHIDFFMQIPLTTLHTSIFEPSSHYHIHTTH